MTTPQPENGIGDDWIVPQWEAPPNVHGFVTTRTRRGAATSDFDLGPARLDALDERRRATVARNREYLGALLPAAPVWLEQVHGRAVATIDATTLASARDEPPVADAAVTRVPEVPLAIRIADCMPVFLSDRDGGVIGAAHAGWRGL